MRNLAYLAYFWYLGGVMAGGIKTRVLVVGGAGYIGGGGADLFSDKKNPFTLSDNLVF